MKTIFKALAAITAFALSCAAAAQDFPTKPVRWVLPFAAGGPADNDFAT